DRLYVPVFQAKPFSQSSEPGDHFVGDQEHVIFVAYFANAWEVVILWDHQSAGALNGLRDKRRDGLRPFAQDCLFQFVRGGTALAHRRVGGNISIWIRRWNMQETGKLRAEHWPEARNTRRIHRADRHAVIS